ncbi:MAG TPA: YndJ family transporter [Microbacterium sp.]|jgi:hypothetical protein|nr:YndJ family transporter [Microbacterium sp.]
MSELTLLRVLLLLAMAMGPLGTHRFFFAEPSRLRVRAHLGALACAALGLILDAPFLCVVWLLFCAASFASFLRERARDGAVSMRSPEVLAACVPFLFSNVAAVWLVGGANDLRILGYGTTFSYYAALHGNVLGWVLVGALAVLAHRGGPHRGIYLASVLVCLVSFLAIAVGIDQLRALKPIGVVGLSLALPASQLAFLHGVWSRNRSAFALGSVSLAGLGCTMVLAWQNELAMPAFLTIAGIHGMVSVHGTLNALVVAPCFLAAVTLSVAQGGRELPMLAESPERVR